MENQHNPQSEQIIIRFNLNTLQATSAFHFAEMIAMVGYRKTHNKWFVYFHGSKGYLTNVEISCEGEQSANNRINLDTLHTKAGKLKSIMVNIYHSEENGVRITLGNETAKSK